MRPEDFVCAAVAPLTAADYAAVAAALGVPVSRIRAVDEVESRGRGFHPESRRPVILYEPHIFSRYSGGRFDAAHSEISYPKWGAEPYPPSQVLRYAQLFDAMRLDEGAALKACSWGRFQLMGFNHKACGFATVQEFVRAMVAGEAAQLAAFGKFVAANPSMLNALRKGDWAGFARLYNGPGYAQHGYDQRLKVAAARHAASQPA